MKPAQCPSCEKDIEPEVNAFRCFECPRCREEFEIMGDGHDFMGHLKTAAGLFVISILVMAFGIFLLLLIDGPDEALAWTGYFLIVGSPFLVPIALIPSSIYLIKAWLAGFYDR